MDIPKLSMAMAQSQLHTDIGMAVLGKALDDYTDMGEGVSKILEQSVTPYLGGNIDVSV